VVGGIGSGICSCIISFLPRPQLGARLRGVPDGVSQNTGQRNHCKWQNSKEASGIWSATCFSTASPVRPRLQLVMLVSARPTVAPSAAAWDAVSGTGGTSSLTSQEHAGAAQPARVDEAKEWLATWRQRLRLRTASGRPLGHESASAVPHGRSDTSYLPAPRPKTRWRADGPAGASKQSPCGKEDSRRRTRRALQTYRPYGQEWFLVSRARQPETAASDYSLTSSKPIRTGFSSPFGTYPQQRHGTKPPVEPA